MPISCRAEKRRRPSQVVLKRTSVGLKRLIPSSTSDLLRPFIASLAMPVEGLRGAELFNCMISTGQAHEDPSSGLPTAFLRPYKGVTR